MATDIMIGVSDPDGVSEFGPFTAPKTSNLTPGGPVPPEFARATLGEQTLTREPRGGITYIHQSVGGVSQPRMDALAGPTGVGGIRSPRARTQPFNGDFIGARAIVASRAQGPVGAQRSTLVQRATSAGKTNVPDRGDMLAGFTNPALASMLHLFRRGGN